MFFSGLSYVTESDTLSDILQAFLIGLRFDFVITSYFTIVPFLALTIISMRIPRSKLPTMIVFYFLVVIFILSFVVYAIDIPFFGAFFTRFSIDAFKSFDTQGYVFKMIIGDFHYIGYGIPLVILSISFFYLLKKAFLTFERSRQKGNIWVSSVASVLVMGLIFIGIRGLDKKPIEVFNAFFCSNAFLNQLALNPNYYLLRNLLENEHLMSNEEALKQIQSFLDIQTADDCSPILRRVNSDTLNTTPPNVVLVFMERMSAARMEYFGNQQPLTPFLFIFANEGYFFENFYSSGIHTHNGIFSTLFSFPTLYRHRNMNNLNIPKFSGMPSTLKKLGYHTSYYTTHTADFDNVEKFLKANDFDEIIEQSAYPSEKVVNIWGVPDDYMFEFAIPALNKRQDERHPFFAVFLTTSCHEPYIIPEYFTTQQSDIQEQAVEYADWSLRKFVQMAAQQSWFDNTLFIFVADHGFMINDIYSLPLNYHHIPMIMYAPKLITNPEIFSCLGGQIDLFPTTMHILGLPYTNNTLGIDLLSEQRPFIYFSSDDKYGVISDSLFLIVSKNSKIDELYRYRHSDKTNYINQYKAVADEMKNYAKANFQTMLYIISQHKQSCK
jgi:phosphoglycerol transferase MdoB-like AlkP superfamily enzyme